MVDLTPSLRHVSSLADKAVTDLLAANQAAAFLLAIVGFLRPSDLHRVVLRRCTIESGSNQLILTISASKERRQHRAIVETILIHPNLQDNSPCPVKAFCTLRDHIKAKDHRPPDVLFVNSMHPDRPEQAQTISP